MRLEAPRLMPDALHAGTCNYRQSQGSALLVHCQIHFTLLAHSKCISIMHLGMPVYVCGPLTGLPW